MWDRALMQQCITTPDGKPWADNNGMDLFKMIIKSIQYVPYTISYNIHENDENVNFKNNWGNSYAYIKNINQSITKQ